MSVLSCGHVSASDRVLTVQGSSKPGALIRAQRAQLICSPVPDSEEVPDPSGVAQTMKAMCRTPAGPHAIPYVLLSLQLMAEILHW